MNLVTRKTVILLTCTIDIFISSVYNTSAHATTAVKIVNNFRLRRLYHGQLVIILNQRRVNN